MIALILVAVVTAGVLPGPAPSTEAKQHAPRTPATATEDAPRTPSAVQKVVKAAQPALVEIKTYDLDGTPLALGSGFFVEGGRVVTNAHVVRGAARADIYGSDGQLCGAVDYAESLSTSVDLAVLPPLGGVRSALRLSAAEAEVGDEVVVFGAPQGLTNTVSTGIVSAIRTEEGRHLLQMSAPVSQGSSGGPVVNLEGEVVGVTVALLSTGQNLNFAVPSHDVRALLNSPKGHFAFPSTKEKEKSANIASQSEPVAGSRQPRDESMSFQHLEVGTVARGVLTGRDSKTEARDTQGRSFTAFSFDGHPGQVVTAAVNAPGFDARLLAMWVRPDGTLANLGQDDTSLDGKNPQLVLRLEREMTVILAVYSKKPGEVGDFTIGLYAGDQTQRNEPRPASSSDDGAGRWVYAATDSSGARMYVDKLTATSSPGGYRQIWVWSLLPKPAKSPFGPYDSTKVRWELDCAGRRIRILQSSFYRQGTSIKSTSGQPDDWENQVPGSIGEHLADMVCPSEE